MPAVTVPFRDAEGTEVATLTVRRRPGRSDRLEQVGEQIVVEEEANYVVDVKPLVAVRSFTLSPNKELFDFDTRTHRHGRLRPRRYVGVVRLVFRSSAGNGELTLAVRPRKLADDEYRQMLDDIGRVATEALLQAFAPAAVSLQSDATTKAQLLYQQFAFLQARLRCGGEDDIAFVLQHPQRAWVEGDEQRPAGTPMRGGSRTLRALGRPGPRSVAPAHLDVPSLPRRLPAARTNETLDNEPNRFVAFALRRWRELAQQVRDTLDPTSDAGPVTRGIEEVNEVIAVLDRALSNALFRDVGPLIALPTGNQVLQKRAGYRELFRTFVLVEAGARLALDLDIEDLFSASQRNIAMLYEYWTFLQLVNAVSRVCGEQHPQVPFRVAPDGMSMVFPGGEDSRLTWTTTIRDRVLHLELYFNRRFRAHSDLDASWSAEMRPDCSLLIRPEAVHASVSDDDLGVWVHFDAKYRVKARTSKSEQAQHQRDDLLKMHAYRDAIRRSAGAYVLYPGTADDKRFTERHEILPGLGAFVLRPQRHGADGVAALEAFLADVLDHVADSASQHERSRYWQSLIFRKRPKERPDKSLPMLTRPPADAMVLLGYVRSDEHWEWITTTKLYNLRAGDRRGAVGPDAELLQALDLVLYGPGRAPTLWSRSGVWFVQSKADLLNLDYPAPGGSTYLCCGIELRDDAPEWLGSVAFGAGTLAPPLSGAPTVCSWDDLLEAAAD